MRNAIREKLGRGELVLGMMHFTGSPMLIEVMARGGLDFAIIDMEHSPIDLGLAAHLVRAADAAGLAPLLRVPDVDAGLIKKVLNLGVQGIVIPHATRARCEAAVQAVRFQPEGDRGACPAIRAAGYAPPDWAAFAAAANREALVIPLVEDPDTLADLEKLLALPNVDVVFLGPFDFAVAAGVPGAGFDHPVIAAALERAVGLARARGKHVMTSVGDRISTDYGRRLVERGVRMISFSADALVFLRACRDIAALKTAAR